MNVKIALLSCLLSLPAYGDDASKIKYGTWNKEIPSVINTLSPESVKESYQTSQEKIEISKRSEEFNRAVDYLNSSEYLSTQEKYRKKISTIFNREKGIEEKEEYSTGRVIVFISESIPLITLRNIARDLERVGGVMYMRGMIGGMNKVLPSALFSSGVLKIDPSCTVNCAHRKTQIMIDPILFRKYGVKKVPAVTIQKGFNVLDYCHSNIDLKTNPVVIYGDASLKYTLEQYQNHSNDNIDNLLQRL